MKNNRLLILTGGYISRDFLKGYLKEEEFNTVIAVDRGLITAKECEINIHYIVGDFDSVSKDVLTYYKEKLSINQTLEIREYNPVKDATDTQIALELALELNASEIVIVGGTGTRMDHVLANIHLLKLPLEKQIKAYIIDEYNKIYLTSSNITLQKEELHGSYISILPLTQMVVVSLEGFKYPLTNKRLSIGDSLGVSNEIVANKANIILQSGTLIVIESRD